MHNGDADMADTIILRADYLDAGIMSKEITIMDFEVKREAIKLFNETWDLLDMNERTPSQDAMMLHKAHTSCHLWSLVGTHLNNTRGEWQVSHVYSVLGMGKPALLHGELALDICLQNNVSGLDLTFGYEAVARAYSILGQADQAVRYKQQALDASETIADPADKKYACKEIQGIN